MNTYSTHIIAILAGLVASAFASGSETALTTLGEARARQLYENGKHSMKLWLDYPDRVLATILLLNTLVNTLAAAIMTDLMMKVFASNGIAFATGAMTLLTLAFGEVTPKALARASASTWGPMAMPIIRLGYLMTKPLVVALVAAPRALQRAFRGPEDFKRKTTITPEEIEYMIDLGVREGVLDRDKSELLTSVLDFGDIVAREMMVPRMNVVAVAADAPLHEVLRVIADSEHSRIPAYENSIDEVVGILHVKSFLAKMQAGKLAEPFDLHRSLTPPFFVPEQMKAGRLLREFQRRHTHLAVVVDEFGGTAGVVTLEDVVEEIVGDIQDELDVEEGRVKLLADGRVVADGAITLRDLEDHLDVDFPEEADYDSLGGFVTHLAGKVPPAGSVVLWGGLRFSVKAGDERRVSRVEISKIVPPLPTDRAGSANNRVDGDDR